MPKKKKAKRVIAKKRTKKIIKKKAVKSVKKIKRAKPKAAPTPKGKLLGRVEHFFDKISVAAISVKAPFKVGDVIHIKGHTTDFIQKLESMQIEHQSVQKVKKGDDIGVKVKDFVRQHDFVYLSNEKELAAKPALPVKSQAVQQSMFSDVKPIAKPASAPAAKPIQSKPQPPAQTDPYGEKKFFSF